MMDGILITMLYDFYIFFTYNTIIYIYSEKNNTRELEVPLLQQLLFSPHPVGERDTKISMLAGHPVGALPKQCRTFMLI